MGQTNKNGARDRREGRGPAAAAAGRRPPNPLAQSLPPKMEESGQRDRGRRIYGRRVSIRNKHLTYSTVYSTSEKCPLLITY